MMVPLLDGDCELIAQEKRYNEAHKKCRCTVERAIGFLKSRFRCLCRKTDGGKQYKESTACNMIVVVCTTILLQKPEHLLRY